MSPAFLLAVSVAVTGFDVEGTGQFVGARLPGMTAKALNEAGCAQAMADELGPQVKRDFVDCLGSATCLVSVARTLPADRVVSGTLRKVDQAFVVQFRVIEVVTPPVTRRITKRMPARLDALALGVKDSAEALCKALAAPVDDTADLDLPPLELPPLVALGPDAPIEPEPDLALAFAPPPPAPVPVAADAGLAFTAPAEPEGIAGLPALEASPRSAEAGPTPPLVAAAPQPVEAAPTVPAPSPVAAPVERKAPPPAIAPAAPSVPPAVVAATKPLPTPAPPQPIPWKLVSAIGGGVALLAGAGLGTGALAISARDEVTMRGGLPVHSISRADAQTANSLATSSVVLLAAGAVLGGTSAGLWLFGDEP